MNDFGGKNGFDGSVWHEVGLESGAESGVGFVLIGENEVAAGEQSGGYGVAGDAEFADQGISALVSDCGDKLS